MAQAIFDALSEDNDLPFRAESAGTAALEGRPITPNAMAALEEVGIYPGSHKARRVSEAMVGTAEVVLAMTPQHAATLRRLETDPAGGIHVLPEYAMGLAGEGIPDPFGLALAAHRSVLRQLYEHIELVVKRLGSSG
jgi:protein-tyrosine-phosphatase